MISHAQKEFGGNGMSATEDNKQLVRDYFTAFLAADETWWREHVAPTFKRHDPGLPFEVVGPAGVKQLADALLPGIPDMELPIEDMVAEGEKVLARLRVRGTHNGKLIEHWALLDNLGMLRQLGVTSI